MENSHGYKRTIILVMALFLLSSAILCWTRYSRAAVESDTHRGDLNQPHKARTATERDSGRTEVARASEAYGKLPMSFEKNCGQTDPRVKFISRGGASRLFLTDTGAVLALIDQRKKAASTANALSPVVPMITIRMSFVGAGPASEAVGRDLLPGNINYFRGKDPSKWLTKIPTFASVQYRDIYPGVNLVYYGNQQQLEYDFEVAAGGDPRAIKLAFEGVQNISIDADGDLVLRAAGNEIRMRKPSVYQEKEGTKQPVAGRYVFAGARQIGFEVGKYDRTRTLVIDPVLSYSTFLGGTNTDEGRSIAVDSGGNAYVTGRTFSFNFPTTLDAYDTTYANWADVFVTKLNAAGSAMVYSTYLGGDSDDYGYGIAVDSSGNAYVTGLTSSSNFPVTPGAFQATIGGSFQSDAFVTKLNGDGTALSYSTYMGGSNYDQANGIAIDSSGNAYVAGSTSSTNFPTTLGAFQTASGGGGDAFVTKLNDTGAAQVYSTYLGGSLWDQAMAIKVDSLGNAYATGTTLSTNFDITAGAYQTTYGGGQNFSDLGDAFATKLNATGTALVYSTYIGGSGDDGGFGLDLAASGEVFLTGSTISINFPTTAGVVRVGNGGMAKSTNGAGTWAAINSGLTTSTELSLAIDPSNPNVVFVGSSGGGVFKSTNGGNNWAATNSGLTDFTIKALTIDPTTTSLMYLGTESRGVFRSTNNGATWKAINTGENGMTVNALKIDPAAASTIYAGTNSGVFKTTNGGANWTARNTGFNQGLLVSTLAIDPVATSTIYAGLSFGGVFKSTNGGANWSATSLTNTNINDLALDPSAPSTLYAGTDNGILKTTDGGSNWSGVNSGLTNRSVNALAISPADSSTLYAGTGNGVFKSTDGGSAWGPGNNGLAGAVVNALAIDPSAALTLYCGSASGSTDAFVTKLNATGTALDYSSFLGGTDFDQGFSLATDTSGNAYVTGLTNSQNFPTTPGGFGFTGFSGEAFVTKLNPTATALVYSTYLGGNSFDEGFGIVADLSGSAYVTGLTQSQNFPTTEGAFQSVLNSFSSDAFISKLAVAPSLSADLGITMTGPSGPLVAGSGLSYDITVTNNGPDRASAVLVNDDLPSSLVFNFCSSSSFSCTHAGNSVTLSTNSLEAGVSVNATLFANVSCSIGSSVLISNTVTVESSATDPNPSNNSATATFSATNPPSSLSPTNQTFPVEGGSGSVFVNNGGTGCGWTSMSNASWIIITFSSNCCNGVVNYNVAANPGVLRTGTMTIAGQTFTVTQVGACTAEISPRSAPFAPGGGTGSVDVTAVNGCTWTATSNAGWITIDSGSSGSGNGTVTYTVASNPGHTRTGTMSIANETFTVNQTGINRVRTIGLYDPTSSTFFLRNTNSSAPADVVFSYGPAGAGWVPIVGDWNGDGVDTIGLYNPATSTFFLRNANSSAPADLVFGFGPAGAGWIPIAGDWNGDGIDTIGLYDPSSSTFFLRNANSSAPADLVFNFGPAGAGWIPIIGDWNADGVDTIGLYNPGTSTFFLSNSNSSAPASLVFNYGPAGAGWNPVAGDWNGDGTDTIGLYNPASSTFFLRNTNSSAPADVVFSYGPAGAGWIPIAGDWDGL